MAKRRRMRSARGRKINIKDFKRLDAKIMGLDEIVRETGERTADILHATSPVEERNTRRRGRYARGWANEFRNRKGNPYAKVKNRTDWQLTWLLENGHLIVNKKGGVGWASPHEHIHKAFEQTSKDFIEACKEVEIEVKLM